MVSRNPVFRSFRIAQISKTFDALFNNLTKREGEGDTHTHTLTDRQTETQTEKQIVRQATGKPMQLVVRVSTDNVLFHV